MRESKSEAIGKRLKGKREQQEEGRERSDSEQKQCSEGREQRVTRSREGKVRAKDMNENLQVGDGKRSSEGRDSEPNKKEHQPRSDSRQIRPSEKLKEYEVKMYTPQIRGVEFKSEAALKEYVERELAGFKHRSDYEKIMGDASAHIRLGEFVGGREGLTLKEIRSLSEEVGLPFRTTRQKISEEGRPQLYRLAEKAITRSEAQDILKSIEEKTGGLTTYDDLQSRLREMDLHEHLQTLKSHEENDRLARRYFDFLRNLSEGGTVTDISRRSRVEGVTGLSWTKGVLPDYVKRVSSESTPESEKRDAEEERKERHGGRIRIERPEIDGIPVESEEHLKKIIAEKHPGVLDMPGAEKMLHEACVHLRMANQLENRKYLQYGEVPKLAEENDIKEGTVRVWATKGVIPRLYHHVENSISRLEAKARFERIREQNNGVMSTDEFNRRMNNYYLHEEWKQSGFYGRDLRVMRKYSNFMQLYKRGGSLEHIARQADVPTSTAGGWLEGRQPRSVRIASGIPAEEPRPGFKWLPRRFVDGRYPMDCFEVPEKIDSYEEVLAVLKQLKPLDNEQTRAWDARYGRLTREEEFMYLLGAYMSDSSIFNSTTLGQSIGIRLSTRYPWSYDFGEGLCQSLGTCGIHAHRVDNTPAKTAYMKTDRGLRAIHQSEKLNWASENSPLVHWINRSCLGYRNEIAKRDQSANADWILDAPYQMRKAVLQGLGDGDGSASVQGNYVCVSSKCNKQFIRKLVESFGVSIRLTDTDVVTTGMDEAKKAAQIPPFRYSESRLEACRRIVKRVEGKRSIRDDPLEHEEVDFILAMKERGYSSWEISEAFFDEFGSAVEHRTIGNVRKKRERKEE